ncbi:hypothetical protein SAMN05421796_11059 [Chryseobacterium piscicola]|uniref:Uncharacterized protein n=2 Tax=Chryseobacterium TaxID=59732 RepID=A0A1N7P128_9FLAO|nr:MULTISPECIES: hypothetical protein [Chryseobacterium]PQA92757.1 hypothetical protein B0A70_10250 [Chryseobacterium piscicola]REC50807.1 hypothetical protein DRF62_18610 [Chryseobacterium piscium]SIT04282.1 hypothetical protein SAMN05421796_11059 [Chryseobacterium piscicola]
MESTTQSQQLFNFSPEILEEIKSMQDYDYDGFLAYSRAIDNLFFEYMIRTVDDPANNIGITNSDVFCIKQVKRLLELLQITISEK